MLVLVAAACALLSPQEIQKVQGEKPSLAKATEKPPDVEQCFWQLPTFAKSISLEVTRGPAAKDLWRKAFHEERGEDEEEKEKSKPERVRGLGKEAYWAGGSLGALYVLAPNAMIRLSVGGPGTSAQKIRKLRPLAKAALRRL